MEKRTLPFFEKIQGIAIGEINKSIGISPLAWPASNKAAM